MRPYTLIPLAAGILAALPSASGQRLTFGAVVGTGLTQDFHNTSTVYPSGDYGDGVAHFSTYTVAPFGRSLIAGPRVELQLRWGLSLEVDALHREMRSRQSLSIAPPVTLPNGIVMGSYGTYKQTHSSWEFPILAKYRFTLPGLKPFVEAGPALRPAGTGTGLTHHGVAAGAGVEMRLRGFNIAPQLRYTRWAQTNWNWLAAQPNQLEFLVGFSRPSTSAWPTAFGHRVSIGALAGIALTDDLRSSSGSATILPGESLTNILGGSGWREVSDKRGLAAGLSVELGVTKELSIEVDGLYRPLHATSSGMGGSSHFAVLTWEFPALVKYKLAERAVSPFVALGPSFRASGNTNGARPSYFGAAAAAGVETRLGRLKLSPQLRYTRWAQDRNAGYTSDSPQTKLNEATAMIGVSF
jgi:hypothetical protein